uniref:Ion_trans domain-containing protein n=1 Tax=Panagrellus redivivus TaxID=6233 RepID=A0A7E4VDL7_PANRE
MPSSLTQLDRLCDKRPSQYTQVILLDDATSVHENLSYKLRLRHIRATVYNFLERPRGTLSFIYHVVIFMYIVLVHSLSALADSPDHAEWTVTTTHNMEYSLAVYFTAEFLVRLWAIGADAKYAGWKGFLKYMCRFISIVDVLILNVTFFVVFSYHSTFSLAAIEKIRFLQILRLLHIDRQMTTWKMIQEMISRSFEELATVYWLSGLVFLLMAYSAFELEGWAEANAKARNITMEPTFRHYGDAFWFGIVSVLTIGYGDIVPRHWLSKLVLSVLCIFGVILFTAASALVGVGMSLMVENETKQQQQTKVRNLAATLIQTWYRFHLISNRDKFAGIPQFRKFCNNLHYVEERFRTARSLAKQSALRKASKRFSQPFKRQTSLPERDGPNEDSNPNDYHAVVTLLNSAPVIGGLMPDYDLNEGARFRAMGANERPSLPSELPPKPPKLQPVGRLFGRGKAVGLLLRPLQDQFDVFVE